ncbi:hypothetical protein PG987_007925 [Apiospora arundinis]
MERHEDDADRVPDFERVCVDVAVLFIKLLLIAIVNIVTIRSNGVLRVVRMSRSTSWYYRSILSTEATSSPVRRREDPGLDSAREQATAGRRSLCQGSHATDNIGVSGKNASDGSGDNQMRLDINEVSMLKALTNNTLLTNCSGNNTIMDVEDGMAYSHAHQTHPHNG